MGVGALAVTKKRTFFNKMAHFLNKKRKKRTKCEKMTRFYVVFCKKGTLFFNSCMGVKIGNLPEASI